MDSQSAPSAPRPLSSVEAELNLLRQQVERLSDRVLALEAGTDRPVPDAAASSAGSESTSSGWAWLARSGVLQRLATISFVLVVALVLRTLTEGDIVDQALGVQLGIGYALLLVAIGWRKFAVARTGRRVFTSCGVVLLCTLVLETHSRLGYLDAAAAHAWLAVALLAAGALGVHYRTAIVVEIGVVAATTTAVAIGFPAPEFHLAALTLLVGLFAAIAMAPLRQAAWLHWFVLVLLLFFWLLWAFKLHVPLSRGEVVPTALRLHWYLPELAATSATMLVIGCLQLRRPGPFGLALPALNVVFACAAAAAVMVPWLSAGRVLGSVALAYAVLHLILARGFASRLPASPAPAASLVLASVVAFLPGTWLAGASLHLSLPVWALAALGVAWWSGRLGSGGMRALGCGLQVATATVAVASGLFAAPPSAPWLAAAVGAAMAVVAGLHYRWTRSTPPPAGTWYSNVSPTDRPGVLTLWAALVALFGGLRVLVHPLLASMPIDVVNAFAGAQSVILNCVAMALLVLAQRGRSRPLLGTAVVVAAVAGVKVFASDFLSLHGVPLVLSVFSFGLSAAVGSVVLGRWQRTAIAVG